MTFTSILSFTTENPDVKQKDQLKIEYLARAEILPTRNARTHSEAQVTQIAASIKEFGFVNPILIDEHNTIIAGHGRHAAAVKLALERVPVIRLNNLSKAQQRALVIADNKIAMNAGWDFKLLAVEMEDLIAEDFDIKMLGFDNKEIADIIGSPDDPEVNDVNVNDKNRHLLMIEFENERALQIVFDEMRERGLEVKIMS